MCRSRSSSANVPGMSPPMRRCSSHIRSYTSSQKSVSWTASLTPVLLEVLARLPAVAADGLVVERQLLLEVRRGELLDEDGGEVDGPLRRDPVGDEPVRDVEEGQVALEGRLGEPVAPVRPAPVVDHHGEVVVQHQRERIHSCAYLFGEPGRAVAPASSGWAEPDVARHGAAAVNLAQLDRMTALGASVKTGGTEFRVPHRARPDPCRAPAGGGTQAAGG